MRALFNRRCTAITFAAWGLAACGSPSEGPSTTPDAGTADISPSTGSKPYGLFEIHYINEATSNASHAYVGGRMYDGAPTESFVWDMKKTEGDCALFTPRTPFCDACAPDEICVDTQVCRTPPSTHEVGDISLVGLNPPSGANPLVLTKVTGSTGTTYSSAETLPLPPCLAGATIRLDASGKGNCPAFAVESQCIEPLVVTNSAIAIESGKTFTLTWTPSTVAPARIQVEFNLSHHGGSKGKLICDTADSGSLQVSGTLLGSLIALGVTGFPSVDVARVLTGTATVGAGQAKLKVYSDRDFIASIPGLISCEQDKECPTGQTCQNPGKMCGVSCLSDANCPTGQTCPPATKMCQ